MFLSYPGFVAGELSPQLEARQDLNALKMGLRLARNVIPTRLGGLLQRPGFKFRGLAHDQSDKPNRLIEFIVSADVAYIMEFGPGTIRFWRDNELIITKASNVGRPGVVSLVGAPLLIETPYPGNVLFELQWCSANDVMWIAHGLCPVAKLVRYAEDEFEYAPMEFLFPPLMDVNVEEITITATGTLTVGGTVTLTASGGDVFEPGNVGGYFGLSHRRDLPYAEISLSKGSATAQASLNFTGLPVANETVTIGALSDQVTYTWGKEGPYGLVVGATVAASVTTLEAAINGTSDIGVGAGTPAHPTVTAYDLGDFAANVAATGTLTCTDNELDAGSSPDKVRVRFGGFTYIYRFVPTLSGAVPYDVLIGVDIAESLLNLAQAMNATPAGSGIRYAAGTPANPAINANETIVGNSLRVTADTAGLAGNGILTDVLTTSRLSWGALSLTGGADASTSKLQVSARIQGVGGNSIATAETMTAAFWNPGAALTGGSDNTSADPSNPDAEIDTVRVNGRWEVYTLGRWYGVLSLQQQRTSGEWETIRTWESKNDRNVQATGVVDGEKLMRLTFVGSGVLDDDAPARAVLTAIDAMVTGVVLITAVISPTVATGTVVKDIWSEDPTYLWYEGSWSERRGYPAAVVLHQQRLTFGHHDTIIGSQVGGFDNFERTEFADSSYQYKLAATVNAHIVSLHSQKGLMILTEDSEWLADGGNDAQVITPQSVRLQKLTEYGSARHTSKLIGSNVIFIQAGMRVANEYLFEWSNQDYTAVDLGELAEHLTREGLKEIAFAPVPHSVVYFITHRGSLLSLSYRRQAGVAEHNGMLAWSKSTTPDGSNGGLGRFESVCTAPSLNEITDVWVSVRRQLPGGTWVRTIESYDTEYWTNLEGTDRENLAAINVLDGSLSTMVTDGLAPIDGLDHLEGLTVHILVDGMVHPTRVVSGGEIHLDPVLVGPGGGKNAVVGLAPLVEVQPWFATPAFKDGGGDGRSFRVSVLNTRFYRSGAAQYADDNDGAPWWDVHFRQGTDEVNYPVPLRTGLAKSDLAGGYQTESRFIFRNQSPLPMNISGVTAEISVHSA